MAVINHNSDKFINLQREFHDGVIAEKFSLLADTFVNTNELALTDFLEKVFESIFNLIPEAQKGSFYELDGLFFRPIFCKGYDFEVLKQLEFSIDDAFVDFHSHPCQLIDSYEVIIEKRDESVFSKETIDIFKSLGTDQKFASLYAPIKYEDKKIGMICLENFDQLTFSNNSKLFLKIYAQFISNYYKLKMHRENETRKYKDIINALVTAIEVKDQYTVGHANRVAEYSNQIAKKLNLPKPKRELIKTAAILHDVGKIGLPNHILNKPGPLTKEEFEIVKMHPTDTKRILEGILGFEEIIQISYMHHEYYDGTGYPNGFKGDEIPLEAQIIQGADALDAMTSDRAYRKAMHLEKVRSIFIEERGKQFHPVVADAIIDLFLSNISD